MDKGWPMISVTRWREFVAERRAVTAIEYALIGSLVAVAIIAAVVSMGTDIGTVFNTVATNL